MNLRIDDCDARILHYFAAFDRIIEDNHLTPEVYPESDPFFKPRMKQRYKLLVNSLKPVELNEEIQRMVKLEPRKATTSWVKPLIIQRVRLQHQYHFPKKWIWYWKGREEISSGGADDSALHGEADPTRRKQRPELNTQSKEQQRRTGSWTCKGPYPTARDDEKESARQKMTVMRSSRRQVKCLRL
ncbi:hypothetical protein PF001_g17760 [Phytophthora fragariae]|uniref:Uncharacterized protein n=2 Tax=Phytophthora fragariae TaxID=53985 RepID=A0A6A3R7U3_9STRA|nr:hypothetical protein PF003_g32422 [Phytophthora fragariae]KAE8928298.1 hypothetical protein PF009_g21554 [Phytophthora fragariae]KAE9090396.1 hypothetical protein PF006_g25171 [Phytophthora fragariae]KAE9198388.1 hypothetical protein PF004_g19550 [Phytophthora fragariae]KAE9294481.1 hypothetical protein PF001_g17760 [Phytophthora fragariae]